MPLGVADGLPAPVAGSAGSFATMSNLPGSLSAEKDDVVGAATPTVAAAARPRMDTSFRTTKSLIRDYEQDGKTIANALKQEQLAHHGKPYCHRRRC